MKKGSGLIRSLLMGTLAYGVAYYSVYLFGPEVSGVILLVGIVLLVLARRRKKTHAEIDAADMPSAKTFEAVAPAVEEPATTATRVRSSTKTPDATTPHATTSQANGGMESAKTILAASYGGGVGQATSLDALYAREHGMWVCPRCETINGQNEQRCQACGADR